MARPKSEAKREAILAAATRLIATEGLGVSTAVIAREAGIATGTLFTYFATKTELLNALYLALKREMFAATDGPLSSDAELKAEAHHVWSHWLALGFAAPEKRKALAKLMPSDEITPASRAAAHEAAAGIAALFESVRAGGALKGQSLPFVIAIVEALAATTLDFMIRQPEKADEHRDAGFDALWRAVG